MTRHRSWLCQDMPKKKISVIVPIDNPTLAVQCTQYVLIVWSRGNRSYVSNCAGYLAHILHWSHLCDITPAHPHTLSLKWLCTKSLQHKDWILHTLYILRSPCAACSGWSMTHLAPCTWGSSSISMALIWGVKVAEICVKLRIKALATLMSWWNNVKNTCCVSGVLCNFTAFGHKIHRINPATGRFCHMHEIKSDKVQIKRHQTGLKN